MSENIIIFSSGESEKGGITTAIKDNLIGLGYNCMDWRNLFSHANDSNDIALLPMLIKKIPTFDFAVLICEGHDITYISRGDNSETIKTMRDNVLFEIGLCAMAIGLNKTILITDRDVRLPDDLKGIHGNLALKQILFLQEYSPANNTVISDICGQIDNYIKQNCNTIHQIVIGAAASTACGYIANFICRTLEHIDDGIEITENGVTTKMLIPAEKIYMHITIPNNLNEQELDKLKARKNMYLKGSVPTARDRPADFTCYLENSQLHIVDYPTNVVTSYDTARIILGMDADDSADQDASIRFVAKEMALYESTLLSLLNDHTFIEQIVEEHYSKKSDNEKKRILNNIITVLNNGVTVTRFG